VFTVFIAADIEGITGYVDWPEKPPEELWFREQMTAEVNASIEGALDAGADKIIVSDIHWRKQNIIPDKLLGNSSLIRGSKRKLMWMDLVERSNIVFLIGFHSGFGPGDAVLPHTMDTRITELKINGQNADEALLSAATAGYFGVPVGLATGDLAFVKGIKKVLPDIETVAVKEAVCASAALNLHPKISLQKIKKAAKLAVQKGANDVLKPYTPGKSVEMNLELSWPSYADALSLIPGVIRTSGTGVSYSGKWLDIMGILSLFVNWVGNKHLI
jgi:D-amino peptidase